MVMNTNDINLSCKKLEQAFNQLNINYKKIDFYDNDINYMIDFSTENSKLFSIKSLNRIDALVYINPDNNSLNFMAINIYNIDDKDDLTYFYEMVNDVNGIINHGKFTIHKDNISRIIYRAVVDYDDNYEIFSKTLLKNIIDDFLENLSVLYVVMKNKGA